MKVGYIGNFGPPHSTENHVARALETIGVEVERLQEGEYDWVKIPDVPCDFLLWTTTYDYAGPRTFEAQRTMLLRRDVPIVGYHLDRWWGLQREHRIHESPFFQVDLLCTADGGHDDRWAEAGIEHVWFPPAVSEAECIPGVFDESLASDVAFVGSWQGGYHPEWQHREQLVRFLRRTYGDRCRFWPSKGAPAVRGSMLRDLYASAKVLVGDSCLAGDAARYWSDRIPETTGRGGYLLHPWVKGLDQHHREVHTWRLGDWDELRRRIDEALRDDAGRQSAAVRAKTETLTWNTYEVRMGQLVDQLKHRGML